ncbi:hypothetical protein [Actinokineospora sp. NBRC 105648]|uniref:hypothetical protein n=1 Tax=Actinokineospora sp. NBRC 105648 TaxID=3032206 RepID=UPI00331C93B8
MPHYLVVGLLVGGGAWTAGRDDSHGFHWAAGGLVGLLVLVAGVVRLFTGGLQHGVRGHHRPPRAAVRCGLDGRRRGARPDEGHGRRGRDRAIRPPGDERFWTDWATGSGEQWITWSPPGASGRCS